MQIHLQRIVGAYVGSAHGAGQFYSRAVTEARDATAKARPTTCATRTSTARSASTAPRSASASSPPTWGSSPTRCGWRPRAPSPPTSTSSASAGSPSSVPSKTLGRARRSARRPRLTGALAEPLRGEAPACPSTTTETGRSSKRVGPFRDAIASAASEERTGHFRSREQEKKEMKKWPGRIARPARLSKRHAGLAHRVYVYGGPGKKKEREGMLIAPDLLAMDRRNGVAMGAAARIRGSENDWRKRRSRAPTSTRASPIASSRIWKGCSGPGSAIEHRQACEWITRPLRPQWGSLHRHERAPALVGGARAILLADLDDVQARRSELDGHVRTASPVQPPGLREPLHTDGNRRTMAVRSNAIFRF